MTDYTFTKLCPSCGEVKTGAEYSWRTERGRRMPNSYCKACKAAKIRDRRTADPTYAKERDAESMRHQRAGQQESALHASSMRHDWSADEDTIVLDPNITARDAALQIGRTFNAVVARRRAHKFGADVLSAHARQQQGESLAGARNTSKQWTGPELEVVVRDDLTAAQVANMLGRTVYAVRRMRARCKRDPRVMTLEGSQRSEI